MAALDFPSSPTVGQQYPSPAVAGVPVYTWDGEKWTTKGGAIGSTGAFDGTPAMNSGAGGAGSSTLWARGDHIHPSDTSRVAKTDLSSTSPLANGVASAGSAATVSRSDHVHPSGFRDGNVFPANGTDLNTLQTSGYYSVQTPVNSPVGSAWVYLRVQQHGSGYVLQHLSPLESGPMQEWVRFALNNVWQPWLRLADANQFATAAEYRNNTAGKILTTDQVWAAAQLVTLTDAASVAPNLSQGIDFVWTITAAGRTLANATGGKPGQKGLIYVVNSAGTITTWGSNYRFPGGTKPTTAAGNTDVLSYAVGSDGATMFCTYSAGFA